VTMAGQVSGLLRHRMVLLGGFLGLATLSVMNASYSYILDSIKAELTLSYTEAGALMSAYFFGYALGQIPWGLLADRYGSGRVMTLSVVGVSFSNLLFGLAGGFSEAAAVRFLGGLLGAGVFVPGVRLVASWFDERERGTALGLLNVGGSLGLIVATWETPFIDLFIGWRLSMMVIGASGLIAAAVMGATLRDGERAAPAFRGGFLAPLRIPSFWALSFVQFIRLGSYYTFIAWLPLMLKEEYGLGLVMAGAAISLFNLAGMVSNPVGGVLSDRIGEKKVLIVSFGLLAANIWGLLTLGPAGAPIYFVSFMLGWLINFVRSPAFTIIPKLFGVQSAGATSGINNTFASIGALTLPLLLGYVRDVTTSYDAGWMTLSGLILVGAALLAMVRVPEG
jgi:ACS family hexuronate transporter-like MFS transporter